MTGSDRPFVARQSPPAPSDRLPAAGGGDYNAMATRPLPRIARHRDCALSLAGVLAPVRTASDRGSHLASGERRLSRRFRFYEKKRGDRRTGSKRFGNVGEALFFGFFLVVGCLALWAMGSFLVVPEWRANRHFAETTCTVLEKHVGQSSEAESPRYRPEIEIEYQVDGQTYRPTTYDATGMYSISRESAEQVAQPLRGRATLSLLVRPDGSGPSGARARIQWLALPEFARAGVVHRHQHAAADFHLAELGDLGRTPQRDVAPGRRTRSLRGIARHGAGQCPLRRQLDQQSRHSPGLSAADCRHGGLDPVRGAGGLSGVERRL